LARNEQKAEEHRGDHDRQNHVCFPAGIRIVCDERNTVAFTELIRVRKTRVAFGTMLHDRLFRGGLR